ncbi:hypothetical protein Tco_1540599 [Tanacetum coccineum]
MDQGVAVDVPSQRTPCTSQQKPDTATPTVATAWVMGNNGNAGKQLDNINDKKGDFGIDVAQGQDWQNNLIYQIMSLMMKDRCDNGGEFRNKEMDDFCSRKGTKEDVKQAEKGSSLRFIALPNWFHEAQMITTNDAAKKRGEISYYSPQRNKKRSYTNKELPSIPIVETVVPTVSTHVPTDSENIFTIDSSEPPLTPTVESTVPTVSTLVPTIIKSRGGLRYSQPPSISNVVSSENRVEDFFGDSTHATRLNEVEAYLSNMETTIQVSPTPTSGSIKNHSKNQISGVRPIRDKRVLKNKKDERGIVIRNKARLVAQGHTQEEVKMRANVNSVFFPFLDLRSANTDPQRLPMIEDILREKMELVQTSSDTQKNHLHAVKRIFRYLKGHPKLGLWYPKESPFDLVAYSDSDYGGASQDRKSTTGGYDNVADLLTKAFDVGKIPRTLVELKSKMQLEQVKEKIPNAIIKWNQGWNHILSCIYVNHFPGVGVRNARLGIETADGETNILAKINGKQRTISESSIRRHLKLNDKEGISTLPDNELFKNLSLMGYNILPNQRFSFQKEAQTTPQASLPHTTNIPSHTPTPRRMTKRAIRISQSKALSLVADESAPPTRGDAEKDSSRSTDKGSESTGDLANVLSSMGAANILASGGLKEVFTTASPQVPTVSSNVSTVIVTTSEKDPTADVLTTTRDTTPYTRRPRASRGVVIRSTSPIPISIPSAGKEEKRKGKEIMTELEKPAKAKVQEQISLQLARELQEEFVHEDQSIREQIERDA